MSRFIKLTTILTLTFGFLLSACLPENEPQVDATATASLSAPVLATAPSATPVPKVLRELTICLGYEPNTLYPYDTPNPAAKSVLDAIYDAPIDTLDYGYEPGVLQKVPSLDDGDAKLSVVSIEEGDWIVDADGDLVELIQGVRVYPAGCQERDCILTYKKDMNLSMERLSVNFSLVDGLRWSDGIPITSDDSVYAYDLAIASDDPAQKFILDRTEAYEAVDPLTIEWRGVPGYRDNTYMTNFWPPMPYHVWNEFTATELVDADVVARFPLGWGPFVVDEWFPGESMRLVKNPLYFRAEEGLPRLDVINFLFTSDPNVAIAALLDGECDLLDPSIPLDGQVELLQDIEASGQIAFFSTEMMSVESLYFGITPADYDDGIVSGNDRPEILSDSRTRQAVALCLDRQRVVDTVLHGLVSVPDSYVPNEHPLYTPLLDLYAFDVTEGTALLDHIGWEDFDNDSATPRTAHNVTDVPSGTELILNYVTTTTIQRRQSSEILVNSLARCGIGVDIEYLAPDEFYAPAPDGILLGRNFDLAQFTMGSENVTPRCDWFMTEAIPNADNDWFGANLSGYSNTDFDEVCQQATHSLPGETAYTHSYQQSFAIYTAELPSIPLYPYLRAAASRPDMCGFDLDPTAQSPLWNIEAFDYGDCAE
jgi:peptide/nickel transport system substrate-binding protein